MTMRIVEAGAENIGGEPCAAALGFFDGVHLGHAEVIAAAKASGLYTAAVTFVKRPGEYLDGRKVGLIMSKDLKEEALAALGVDAVVYLDFAAVKDYSPEKFVKEILIDRIHARNIVCGFNYRFGKGAAAGCGELAGICRSYGVGSVSLPPVCVGGRPVSSTRIRALISKGDVRQAEALMGRPFALCLPVAHGRMLGRRLGFPTINQKIPSPQLTPLFGVYATGTAVDGRILPSVTNVGVKPTVGSEEVLAETYIAGYEGDLYGKTVKVLFHEFLRPEKRFPGLDELRRQIEKDAVLSRRQMSGLLRRDENYCK